MIPSIKLVPFININKQKEVKRIANNLFLSKKSIKYIFVDKIFKSKKYKKHKITKNWIINFFKGLVITSKSEKTPKIKIKVKKKSTK